MSWHFTWWTGWDEVWGAGCQAPWRELLAAAEETAGEGDVSWAFQRPELVRAWAETRGRCLGARPVIGLASDDAGTRVLLPWVVSRQSGRLLTRRVLEPAGQALFAYHGLPASIPAAMAPAGPVAPATPPGPPTPPTTASLGQPDWAGLWEEARRELAGRCDLARLRFVPAGQGVGWRASPCGDPCPVIELAGVRDFEELLARASANLRAEARRKERRLAREGPLELWLPGAAETGAAAADLESGFLPAYHALWQGQRGGDLLAGEGMVEFLGRVLGEGLAGGWAHYAVLRLGGEPIAWHLGLLARGELLWWFPAYSPAWSDFSPGLVLLCRLLAHGLASGWRRCHLLTGAQRYKLSWRPRLVELRTVRWHSPGARGRLLALYDSWHRPAGRTPAAGSRTGAGEVRAT